MALSELPADHDLGNLHKSLSHCKDFRTAIDGGAHQGIWTRELLKKFDRVIAFEPTLSNFEKLPEESFNRNIALGEEHRKVSMYPGPENTGQYHVGMGAEVLMYRLDDVIQKEPVDFLKLDVEGYELQALKGARKTIDRCHPLILIEDNGLCERYGVKMGEAGDYLISLGYKMVKKMNKDYLFEFSPG